MGESSTPAATISPAKIHLRRARLFSSADYLEDTDFDEETFYHLEKRLDELNHLKSKYGSTIEEILSACEEKKERLLRLKDYLGSRMRGKH